MKKKKEYFQNKKFLNYSNLIFQKYENNYDLLFIDGIFRVLCLLQTILNCKNDIKILIHDINYAIKYHIIFKYLEVIYSIDTKVLFCIKKYIDIKEVKKIMKYIKIYQNKKKRDENNYKKLNKIL